MIDTLQRQHVPLDAMGIQAHLLAAYWDSFDRRQYRRFLKQISDRGLKILITEMDVLDDGLPADDGGPGPGGGRHLRRATWTPRSPTRRSRR